MQLTFMYLMQQVRNEFGFRVFETRHGRSRVYGISAEHIGLGTSVDQIDVAGWMGDAKVFHEILIDNDVPHSGITYVEYAFNKEEYAAKAIHILIFLIAYVRMLNAGFTPYPLGEEPEEINMNLSSPRKLTQVIDDMKR